MVSETRILLRGWLFTFIKRQWTLLVITQDNYQNFCYLVTSNGELLIVQNIVRKL